MKLRSARVSDARTLWKWANDPETRRASLDSSFILWTDHQRWLRSKLGSREDVRIFIAERPRPVAQVRFERSTPDTAIVSIVVAPESRGMGLGTRALSLACPRAARMLGVRRLWAYVKVDNLGSRALFRKAGFRALRKERKKGAQVVLFSKRFPPRTHP